MRNGKINLSSTTVSANWMGKRAKIMGSVKKRVRNVGSIRHSNSQCKKR
jgi:hypothetical protein